MNRQQTNAMLEVCLVDLFAHFNIDLDEYITSQDSIRGICPIHFGDNPTAFTYYFEKGVWFCWTQHCHEQRGSDLIGFIAARRKCSSKKAFQWAQNFLENKKINKENVAEIMQKKAQQTKKIDYWQEHIQQKPFNGQVLEKLKPINDYIKKRGISLSLAKKLGAGYAVNGSMKGRLVLPVKNIQNQIVGFTGRAINDSWAPKWLHLPKSPRFKSGLNLFGINIAAKHMRRTSAAIIVEGPFDFMKMYSSGYRHVAAIFGLKISPAQIELLKRCAVVNVITAFDPDRVDSIPVQNNINMLKNNNFDVKELRWQGKEDIGAMKISKIRKIMMQFSNLPNFQEWRIV